MKFFSILFLLLFAACQQSAFEQDLQVLQNGKVKNIELQKYFQTFTIKPLYKESEIDQMVLDEAPFSSNILAPITKNDILLTTKKFVLVKTQDVKYLFPRTFAITLNKNGQPIEAIVLAMNEGNSEVKISRNYDYFNNIEFHFDPKTKTFTTTDRRYDTEWETPTHGKDVVTFKTKLQIKVDENGHFILVSKKELPHKL